MAKRPKKKTARRAVASTLAPDIYVDGKLWKGGRSIMDFMASQKRTKRPKSPKKSAPRPVADMHAPDLWEVGEDGKKRRYRGHYIWEFMPGGKYAGKSKGSAK
jgi:hypothetical protein